MVCYLILFLLLVFLLSQAVNLNLFPADLLRFPVASLLLRPVHCPHVDPDLLILIGSRFVFHRAKRIHDVGIVDTVVGLAQVKFQSRQQ